MQIHSHATICIKDTKYTQNAHSLTKVSCCASSRVSNDKASALLRNLTLAFTITLPLPPLVPPPPPPLPGPPPMKLEEEDEEEITGAEGTVPEEAEEEGAWGVYNRGSLSVTRTGAPAPPLLLLRLPEEDITRLCLCTRLLSLSFSRSLLSRCSFVSLLL